MKIGIPTMGSKGLEEMVSEHFGRAPTFTIIDTETMEIKVIGNTGEHMGGIGKPPELLAKEDVQAILCSGLGIKAKHSFEENGIEVYIGAHGTVEETIDLWKKGKLFLASDKNTCKMHRH